MGAVPPRTPNPTATLAQTSVSLTTLVPTLVLELATAPALAVAMAALVVREVATLVPLAV